MNTKELTELIMRIADSEGVSGDETATAELCRDELLKYTDDVQIKNGNVIANFGKRRKNKPHVLLDAHLDRVGLIVTSIT